jgi:hypothetical protein
MFRVIIIFLLFNVSIVHAAETFYYTVHQGVLKVGDAQLELVGDTTYKNTPVKLVKLTADGFNFLDKEEIYLDPHTYRPLFVERDLNIFGSKEKISEEYTPGKIIITKTVGSKTYTQVIDKQGDIENIYGFIWRYRLEGTFEMNDSIQMALPTKDIVMKVAKLTTVSALGQKLNAVLLQSQPMKYQIWFDQTERKLPLRIAGAVGVGNTVMVLRKVEP